MIPPGDNTRIAFLIAPTGCGKTHIADCLLRQIELEFTKRMKEDAAFLPAACIDLGLLTVKKQFNWGEFYEHALIPFLNQTYNN